METFSNLVGKQVSFGSSQPVKKLTCKEHGEFESSEFMPLGKHTGRWSTCPECKAFEDGRKLIIEREREHREKQESLSKKLRSAGVPVRYLKKTFDNYVLTKQNEKVFRACKKYADDFKHALKDGKNMIFCGGTGTGKNHLASAIANSVSSQGYTVAFDDVYMSISDIRHAMNSRDQKETDAIRSFALPDLFIFDEIGDQLGTDSEKRLQNKIFDCRYSNMKPTIILSNLPVGSKDGPSISSVLGNRIMSRMAESGEVLIFNWDDYRRRP